MRGGLPGPGRTAARAAAFLLLLAGPLRAQQANSSPHGALPEGSDCATCHTADAWSPAREDMAFQHDRDTRFPLTGEHQNLACASCHADLRFDAPFVDAGDCRACHVDPHQGRAVERCATCHTTRSFREVDGEAVHQRTAFPLTGAHLQITCESCHVDDAGGSFTSVSTDCVSCHREDYRNARAVDHVAAGFPDDCTGCHSSVAWSDPPPLDHVRLSNGFALLGAHQALPCSSCHAVPGYTLLFPAPSGQDDCVACHQADYDREHAGTGFPTTCSSCHTVERWSDASFDHDGLYFPIYSGAHRGRWSDCTSCHEVPGTFSSFTCLTCHEQTSTDPHHREVRGYLYDSEQCYSCHRNGRGD